MKILHGTKVLLGPSTFAELDYSPLKRLASAGFSVVENHFKRKLTKAELIDLLTEDVEGLIAGLEPLDHEVMRKSNLRVISRCGSGMSNVDVDAAKGLGIKVCSTPDGPTTAVAELTIGAMISLLRMIPLMDHSLRQGSWNKLIGTQLAGKTVAIIGFGRIGRRVARLLSAFNSRILVIDPFLNEADEEFPVLKLEDALPQADIVTLHASGETTIISKKEFGLIKPGAFLLNAARGGLIDENDMAESLREGRIQGAWIDTFGREPYKGPLTGFEQVILTPHVGSYTLECRRAMEMESVENLINAFRSI